MMGRTEVMGRKELMMTKVFMGRLVFLFLVMVGCFLSMVAQSEEKGSWVKGGDRESSSDRLDIKQLEDSYWSAKDTDMTVVQNRTYTKNKRFFNTIGYGVLINDSFSYGRMTDLTGGYYFSERWGMEIGYERGNLWDNDGTLTYKTKGVSPNYNTFSNYTYISGIWVPFYSKTSFLDRKIVYFDIQFGVNLGKVNYISVTDSGGISGSSTGFGIDFTQQLFFSRHLAFRFDLRNRWYSQDNYLWSLNSQQTEANRYLKTTLAQDTSMIFGFTIFY